MLTLCLGGDFGVGKLGTYCSLCLMAGAADVNAPIAFLPIINSLLELTAVIMRFNRSLTAFNSHGWAVMNMLECKKTQSFPSNKTQAQKTSLVFLNEPLHLGPFNIRNLAGGTPSVFLTYFSANEEQVFLLFLCVY